VLVLYKTIEIIHRKGGDNEYITRKILSLVAAAAIALSNVTSVAAVTIEVTGNGSDSNNKTVVNTTQNTSVVQNNDAHIDNNIYVSGNTGDNTAKDNTGGDVKVKTGDSTTKVEVANTANSNSATVDCCVSNDTSVKVSGNGTDSDNDVVVAQTNTTSLFQDNDARVDNHVNVKSSTGDNNAEDNTGGEVSVKTGDTDSTVTLSTVANMNTAKVGGNGGSGSSLDVQVSGNGSDSDTDVALVLAKDISVVQGNDAHVKNDVKIDAETGDNDAKDNTGGEVSIKTGDAKADLTVDNSVNFNAADVDCGCALDASVKVGGNGTDSENEVSATLLDTQEVFQGGEKGNDADLFNKLSVDGETGDNEVKDSTATDPSDPTVTTGDSDTTFEVSNTGNVNTFGPDAEVPETNFHVTFNLSWATLMHLLGLE
jgi:hypothetical protein